MIYLLFAGVTNRLFCLFLHYKKGAKTLKARDIDGTTLKEENKSEGDVEEGDEDGGDDSDDGDDSGEGDGGSNSADASDNEYETDDD